MARTVGQGALVCALVCGLAAACGAQNSDTWLRVGAGVDQSAIRNPAESPYRYGGEGVALSAAFGVTRSRSEFVVSLDGSTASMHSVISQSGTPHSALTAGGADFQYVWSPNARDGAIGWRFGVDVQARAEDDRHTYAVRYNSTNDYGYAFAVIGPLVRTGIRLPNGTLTNGLTMPLAGWIDCPYSNRSANGSSVDVAFAVPPRLSVLDDAIRYRVGAPTSFGVSYVYRFSFVRYVLGDARISVRQSLLVVAEIPLSGRTP